MTRTLIVIPARMAATRLPGKPMVDIAGEPMIVHVWRRAMQSRGGPRGRCRRYRRDRGGGAGGRRRGAADAPRSRLGLGPDLSRRSPTSIPMGMPISSSTCKATCRRWSRIWSRACLAPLAELRPTSPRSPPRSSSPRSAPIPTWSRSSARRSPVRPPARALLHARHRAPRRRTRFITTSAFTPTGARRCSASSACAFAAGAAREARAAARARSRHAHRRRDR